MGTHREIEEKIERVLRLIREADLSGVFINTQHNFAWLTAGGRNGIDLSREAGVGSLLVRRDGRKFVLANKIEIARLMKEELDGQGYEPVEFAWEDEKGDPLQLRDRARSLMIDDLPIGADFSVDSFRSIEPALARLRYRLTDEEIDRYRALGRDTGEAIGRLVWSLEPGMTEREVARRAADELLSIDAFPVVTLVAADDRLAQFRHPVPTARPWKKVLMVVVCARRGGLIASLSRIVCVGAPPAELMRRTELTAGVLGKLLAATRPGVSGAELFSVAVDAYSAAGFAGEEHKHHQGGATGYRTREWTAHPVCREQVVDCQAFAWNPSITGTKVEETAVVVNGHIGIITQTPGWPVISAGDYSMPSVLIR